MPAFDYVDAKIAALPELPLRTEPRFGRDISCWDTVDPGFRMVQGDELLRQIVHRCITTAPGEMWGDPNYSLDVQQFLHTNITNVEIAARITARVKRDPRFSGCQTTVTRNGLKLTIDIKATPVGAREPIAYTSTVEGR